ncbi:envelope glycoprotein H [Falconid herpesvirus 1]|uniref:Envelope glycoprotein H n=2 Tax=Columbid alphaherpesvirus 1 TaxID=93386 RepID=A0A068ES03_9ALPH|nr:envelope glycoprotein H [Falconid herpesvirus 1]YP_009352929.1 envelope glycoprotein H [Columbid alphaherpesvirus 1]AID52725.1 envelope glycoprotein H [Falconid herpesvirus 1]ARD71346.1 envelope glycoprotein H [Columbid alphaherpesvirus 1]
MICHRGRLVAVALLATVCGAYANPARAPRAASRSYRGRPSRGSVWLDAVFFVSSHLPPPNGFTRATATSLKWNFANYTFFYVSEQLKGVLGGSLLFFKDTDMAKITTFSRPKSRLLVSGNIVQYLMSGSVPSNPFLTVPIPHSDAMVPANDNNLGATFGYPAREPSSHNPPKTYEEIDMPDLLRANDTFVLTSTIFGGGRQTCFVDAMAVVLPRHVRLVRTMRFGSDHAEVIMKFGVDFATLTISMRYDRPIELILVKQNARSNIIWPSYGSVEPVHSLPNTAFKTYVIGPRTDRSDTEYRIMVDMATIADESLDRLFQSSQAHVTMLTFASNAPLDGDDAYFFRLVITRLWMTVVSAIHGAYRIASISLEDLISAEADVKLLAESIFKLALKGDPDSFFMQTNTPIGGLKGLHLKMLLTSLIRDMAIESYRAPFSMDRKRDALRLAYVLDVRNEGRGSLGDTAAVVALRLIEAMHDETLFNTREWNSTTRHASFYAFMALLRASSPDNKDAIRNARRGLLLATSMCTEEHLAANQLSVKTAFVRVVTKSGPFSILDTYSPCATSLRGDISDYAHRVHSMLNLGGLDEMVTYMEKAPQGAAMAAEELADKGDNIMNTWHDSIKTLAKAYVREVVECPGTENSLDSAVMVIPSGESSSYVLTRKPGPKGVTYKLDGVSISNPLVLTFVVAGTCVSSAATIPPVRLPRPTGHASCPYCGCVLLRYTHGGMVRHAIFVDNLRLQQELVAGLNSSVRYFDPSDAAGRGTSLLLFPNGTVVRIVAFEGEMVLVISDTFISMAVVGSLLAFMVLVFTIRMIVNYCRDNRYEALINLD